MNSYDLRSKPQYEILVAISFVEKAKYLASAAQQLKFDILVSLLPHLKENLMLLKSISVPENEIDMFVMDFVFSLKSCIFLHEKLVRAVENSFDDMSLYENICLENGPTLVKLSEVLTSIWKNYWQQFHVNDDKKKFLLSTKDELIKVYSDICIMGNEQLPDDYSCLSCCKASAYLKTGITNQCENESFNVQSKKNSMNYCHHLITTNENSKYRNMDRIIFERRMNEIGTRQQ